MKKRATPSPKLRSRSWWFLPVIFSRFMYTWNTMDVFMFMVTLVYLQDTKTPTKSIPSCPNNPRRFVHRSISYDDILLVKTSLKMVIIFHITAFILFCSIRLNLESIVFTSFFSPFRYHIALVFFPA